MAKSAAKSSFGYLLIGSGVQGNLSEIRGVFATQEEAQAEADEMSAQPNIVIVEVSVVQTIAGSIAS